MDVENTSGSGRNAYISIQELAAKDNGGDKITDTCALA
jgi:hypothetical protein